MMMMIIIIIIIITTTTTTDFLGFNGTVLHFAFKTDECC